MVEAAGVEPASEEVTGRETTYLVAFPLALLPANIRRPRSEYDKKREPLVLGLASGLGPHPETSLLCDALSRPIGEAAEDGNLTN